MHERQTDGQSKLYTLIIHCLLIQGIEFPPKRYGWTDWRTDKVNYRVASLIKEL